MFVQKFIIFTTSFFSWGRGVNLPDKWQIGAFTQEPLCLLSCQCTVPVSVLMLNTTDYTMLLLSSDHSSRVGVFFHSGSHLLLLWCLLVWLRHRSVFRFAVPLLDTSECSQWPCTSRKCRNVSILAQHDGDVDQIRLTGLNCNIIILFLFFVFFTNTWHINVPKIYNVTDYMPLFVNCCDRCILTMYVPVVCKCVRTPPYAHGVDVHICCRIIHNQ